MDGVPPKRKFRESDAIKASPPLIMIKIIRPRTLKSTPENEVYIAETAFKGSDLLPS